ncbi:SAM and PH domain protein (Boi1), putative [Talaromyces stipitatus ATCC 10500]|uniref:SAM and PH domain protein (Boi1), putative n=1 Tax=Talaromyces stipitatus (strain ATCC 10500 / CBS 375.48 / QM 6759 / NRRL 1006) TaxID=441959 RepID=B8MEB1_TALSN|nr:SAM and PH domain protein (Boi1), putative [Talaromyces stipitatus ATCC 10500]EED16538.1 SAM and PH domain protein (Boi1), putative [Talaromyces stipitatus ATCC 10500]
MPPKYPAPFLPRHSNPRPLSQATEIFDTDFESDYEDDFDYSDESPRRSLATDSVTTISTYRDVRTPDSHMLGGNHMNKNDVTVKGPSGPHLFRASMDSTDLKSTMEVDLVLAKTPTTATFSETLKLEAPVKKTYDLPTRERPQPRQANSINNAVSNQNEEAVKKWTPKEVAFWMHTEGFDHSLVEKFLMNDISGSILLELRPEDLKELEIQSFGKRRRLMNSIQTLRDSARMSTAGYRTSGISGDESWTSEDESKSSSSVQQAYQSDDQRSYTEPEEIRPGDSASIVAIEQVLPKEHKCSKGENCRKWQRQQQLLARLAQDLPKDSIHNGNVIVAGDPGNPRTAPNLLLNIPDHVPSVVASSDLLGPQQVPQFALSKEKLSEVQPRDPQESIRQYLNLQHLCTSPVDDPVSPPQDITPDSFKSSPNLTENLRTLPKLTIPNSHEPSSIFSAQRTITPSVLQNQPTFPHEQYPHAYDQIASPGNYYRTSDDYRADIYRQGTPFSEVDVPVTAIPAGPIERDITQSVPPNMRFGHQRMVPLPDPILRPSSTKNDRPLRRNHPFINTQGLQSLGRVEEGKVAVIERPEDLQGTGLFPRTANDFAHSGWMKKRKTTRLLRHEWEEHHFTLKGTQLAMFENERDSRRDSRALECIDVDDYAVACSSLASSSKLSAAFKKTLLKRNNTAADESAFAFSLVPSKDKDKESGVDRKALFLNGGKSHHFAVKTRDERIDWMRELMLAKALKRGKESGDLMRINGNMI